MKMLNLQVLASNAIFFCSSVTGKNRHTIFFLLKTRTLQNNEPYQINVVHILLGVLSYFGFP